jgi:hypothetical protein
MSRSIAMAAARVWSLRWASAWARSFMWLRPLLALRRITRMKSNRIFLLLIASFFTLFSSGQSAAQSPAPVTLVKAGRLLDPRTYPIADITEIERVRFVMKNGEVVRNDFASH